MKKVLILIYFLFFRILLFSQTGISVSPPRIYFETTNGQSATQKVIVTNVSSDNVLDLSLSLGDWEYDRNGENMIYEAETLLNSAASWITVKKEDTYFSLKPGEKKEIEISLTAPNTNNDTLDVHTAMFYVTQMNPIDDLDQKGATIKVSVRSGIKIFHRFIETTHRKIEIQNVLYKKDQKQLLLIFENTGNIWSDGKIFIDLLNTKTGKKETLNTTVFYSMPGNIRDIYFDLPKNLEANTKYTATLIIDYGDENTIEMAELKFTYE